MEHSQETLGKSAIGGGRPTEMRSSSMDVRVAQEPGFDFCGDEYARLYETSNASAFQHPLWLSGIYRTLAPHRGAVPAVVIGREAVTGRLLFVLPLTLRNAKGAALLEAADLGVSDYAAPVVEEGWLKRTNETSILAEAVSAALPAHDLLRIRPIREEHVDIWRLFLPVGPERQGFSAHAVGLAAPYGNGANALSIQNSSNISTAARSGF
jgi:hypothetical protein